MIQYYTALGRYELRTNVHGDKFPVLINNQTEYSPDLCEMILWSLLLWHIRDQKALDAAFTHRKEELHIFDDYSLQYYCGRLERLGFLGRGSGYTAIDALFDLLAPLYPVPAAAHFPVKLFSFFHLVLQRNVPLRVAFRVFRRERLTQDELQVMGLISQTDLSTAELIACIDQKLMDLRSDESLLEVLYSESQLTCDNLPAYVRSSCHLIPVLQTITNLYLRRLLVLEQY